MGVITYPRWDKIDAISLDNGLVPDWRQTVIWTIWGLVQCNVNASPGSFRELKSRMDE